MSKLFTFAGTCVENNAVVYKFANDAKRARALERFGCTDVNLVKLPVAMDKEPAIAYLATLGISATQPARVTKVAANKPAKSATVKVKVKPVQSAASDELTKEAYTEAMSVRKANDMPTVSFAQYKRDAAKVVAFFAKCNAKIEETRAAEQVCF